MATAPAPPAQESVDLAQVTAAFIRIRDAKSERKKQMEAEIAALDEKLDMLGGFLLNHLNQQNADSVRTDAGTFFRQEEIKPSIADDTALFAWVKENDAFDLFERRVSKGFVKEYLESHEGGLPPPGVAVHREYVVRVRKAAS